MNSSTTKIIKINFENIKTYKFQFDITFKLEINYNNIKYPFIIKLSSIQKNIICFGENIPNNINNSQILTPTMDSIPWYESLNDSFIIYLDPNFIYSDETSLNHFNNTQLKNHINNLATIIKEFSKNKLINKNITLIGGIEQGFTSLYLGTLIKNSKVIINLQSLNINNIGQLKMIFPEDTFSKIKTSEINQLKFIDLFEKYKYVPNITFLSNINSKNDFKHHIPIITEISTCKYYNNNLNIAFYNEKSVPSNESIEIEIRRIIHLISKNGINQRNSIYEITDDYNELCKYQCNKQYITYLENNLMRLNKKIKKISQKNKILFKKNSDLLNKNHELTLRSKRYEQKIKLLKNNQKNDNSNKFKLKNIKKYFSIYL